MSISAAVLGKRLRNQRLIGSPLTTPEAVVACLGAVQAQDYYGASWALALRAPGLSAADVDAAFDAGRILRTHVLRPTWHFVTPDDIGWLLALTGPRVQRANRSQGRKLGLDDECFARSRAVLTESLAGGRQLTRAELAAAFTSAGIGPDRRVATSPALPNPAGQVMAHLLMDAELAGVICSGPRRGKQFTYMRLEERAPEAVEALRSTDRETWLARVAQRYFESHGPATPRDFAWWSGLTLTDVRRAIAAAGVESLVLAAPAPGARVRGAHFLLPNYDEYLVAYRHREALVDARHTRHLGVLSRAHYPHYVILDGRIAGSWQRELTRGLVRLTLRLHTSASTAQARGLRAEAARLAKFLGSSAPPAIVFS